MFHLVSAFEGFISCNFGDLAVYRAGIQFLAGDPIQVVSARGSAILLRIVRIDEASDYLINSLGLDTIVNLFEDTDWIVFHESAEEELDNHIYSPSSGTSYSIEETLAAAEPEEYEASSGNDLEDLHHHEMAEAYAQGWRE